MPEAPIVATFHGHVASTRDALIVIEACLVGRLNHLGRRPRQSEEPLLPRSGNVFVYERRSSGITSWQDGVSWSTPVLVGNFEMRRQAVAPFGANRINGRYTRCYLRCRPVCEPRQMLTVEPGTCSAAGLCRRSLSVTVRGATHHLVAYFDLQALMLGTLSRPSASPELADVVPRNTLLSQGFAEPAENDDQNEILRLARP